MPEAVPDLRRRYLEELAAGRHDEECEQAPSFYLCHCAKRAREAAGYTEHPGPLAFGSPPCPRCYRDVHHDGDVWVCATCKVQWDNAGEPIDGFTDDYGDLHPPARAAVSTGA